jgi:FlaA1/EpsC-like NDP-sugar epimerase
VARFDPGCLVILERSESDLFRIHHELMEANPRLKVIQAIADIREYERVLRIIKSNHVSVIFHAAAYKHVPLMEENIIEAVRNNVLGTYNVAKAAKVAGVNSFIQVSTDKAVNPTNIMGLTKRLTELIVSAFPIPTEGGSTKFVSVRFGNVLGSNGSVIPIFKQQIQSGGPVTVTHPDMRRYFMTIPEAAQLVLQAGMMSQGSEIFVLDMGEPVKIVDLARNMIRLSGHEPDQDIEIRYVGLRPGEKLHEEINLSAEDMQPTYHNKIRIFCGPRKHYGEMEACVRDLNRYVASEDDANLLRVLMAMVPEYTPSGHWRSLLANAKPQLKAISAAG